eukprot:CAMPEP_0179101568 /NCGR_PEP_ID=MMETSP0796-20121207/46967_1 /TAXON_ID=73915 /ORGANISM="Pyrodinium bahamense, Strain pbaha01" /LENGTH=231 /DNA_ID=CAMNT_0020799423 /DNA_START=129 /DNA_END=825 /DNA_ORIENTATION=+
MAYWYLSNQPEDAEEHEPQPEEFDPSDQFDEHPHGCHANGSDFRDGMDDHVNPYDTSFWEEAKVREVPNNGIARGPVQQHGQKSSPGHEHLDIDFGFGIDQALSLDGFHANPVTKVDFPRQVGHEKSGRGVPALDDFVGEMGNYNMELPFMGSRVGGGKEQGKGKGEFDGFHANPVTKVDFPRQVGHEKSGRGVPALDDFVGEMGNYNMELPFMGSRVGGGKEQGKGKGES